jgi:transposase
MGEVTTIGLDIAKSVFQVHGVDGAGEVAIRKRISRARVLEYFGDLWGSKLARQRIIGAAS